MSKRDRPEDERERPPKRPRHDVQRPHVDEVHYARQLQDFLVFRQDGIQQLRNGIASFKTFLESVLYHKEEDNRGRQISILREYLESQKPADPKDLERPFLSQLWQAWSFANQNNNDHLASSISAILALLLKTLSGILDLREHGFLLCRTVLHYQHLRLIKRCLDAPKHKEFLISPCLRLLTEVISFDGGVLAREVYKHREQTFDVSTLRRCLSLVKIDISEEEARRKPAVRTLALRYLLGHLKYLHEGGKIDVVKNRPLCSAIFQHIRDDPADLVKDILGTIEQSILRDAELPRSSKAALLTPQSLEKVTQIATQDANDHGAAETAFAWLKAVCTKVDYGILRPSGWYSPGVAVSDDRSIGEAIDLGLDSVEHYDQPGPINVRNPTLLAWAQSLRAHTNHRERDLLLTCFASAPELVAPYFSEKTMQLDPKLSNTWIGYASVLFEVVALKVPPDFGSQEQSANVPPQTTIMIENVLPRTLTQVILSRCLNQSSELITFFASRILVLAFQKLSSVLDQMKAKLKRTTNSLWDEAADRLRQRFFERCPPMKDVIAAFRRLPDDEEHDLQREVISRLLSLYYRLAPEKALEESFDISGALTATLNRQESSDPSYNEASLALSSLEIEHLLVIARYSTGMKWFSKQGGLKFSPITTLLKLHRGQMKGLHIRTLLEHVLVEHNILNNGPTDAAKQGPVTALVASVARIPDTSSVWSFIDDCVGRAARKPVKYVDDLETLAQEASLKSEIQNRLPSLLAAVILEQASFVTSDPKHDRKVKFTWAQSFLGLLGHCSDSCSVLNEVRKQLSVTSGLDVQDSDDELKTLLKEVELTDAGKAESSERQTEEVSADHFELNYKPMPREPPSHPELTRWSQKDVDIAIDDGDISALFLCLCSEHGDVRRQAMVQLARVRLELLGTQSLENSAQLALLAGETLETYEQHFVAADSALPYLAGTFAIRALDVLTQPHHFMYPKINRFLIRGPEWRVHKLPNYWLSNSILSLPEDDDAYWREVQWVLDWLVDGLRTNVDLNILRRGSIFEKVCALWHSPGAGAHKHVRDRICELLYRAGCIEGGSDMLATRTGVLSWLDITKDSMPEMASALRAEFTKSCDPERLRGWIGSPAIIRM